MALRIGFYHLTALPLEQALPRLLDKILAAGHRVVVMAGSEARRDDLDDLLWTWKADSWLPHGTARDGDGADQPIWLTAGEDNPNQADVLVLTDGVVPAALEGYNRCLTLFDGRDEALVAEARRQWSAWKTQGHVLTYYQQSEQGGWVEKMTVNAES